MSKLFRIAMIGLLGCNGVQEEALFESQSQSNHVVAWAPQRLTATTSKRSIGEDCDRAACETGLCLHVKAEPSVRVCSSECEQDYNCPKDWRCASFLGGPTSVCLPPSNWQFRSTAAVVAFRRLRNQILPRDSFDGGQYVK